jgi:hypothetical protein
MKPRRWIAIFDSHGDKIHEPTARVVQEFMRVWKPTIRIHGGDAWDFRWLRKGAVEGELRELINDDMAAGMELMRWFKPTHFLRGNHDERLWDCLLPNRDDGKIRALASLLIDEIAGCLPRNCRMYPYDKRTGVMELGHLRVIHGYHSGITAAKQAAQIYGSVLMGHVHSVDQAPVPNLECVIGRACGCLCELDLGYNRAQANTLKHAHGFAYGLLHADGTYHVWQASPINGLWVMPTEFREYR